MLRNGELSLRISSTIVFLLLTRLSAFEVHRKAFIEHSMAYAFLTNPSGRTLGTTKKPSTNSNEWRGTQLSLMTLQEASDRSQWPMGRWPDPILRRIATNVDESFFGTPILRRACHLLKDTAQREEAVGLAAQQCGVDARIVYLQKRGQDIIMVNPRIVARSDERDMKIWKEYCLVLPPNFRASVLRDAWVDIDYRDMDGTVKHIHLVGELARAAQHELDHDRGILILDHVSMEELENDTMRSFEAEGHQARQRRAYTRYLDDIV